MSKQDYYYYYPDAGRIGAEPLRTIGKIVGRAYLECALSGLRFSLATSHAVLGGQMRLVQNFHPSEDPQRSREKAIRILADETRRCLRELGEAATSEASRLRSHLTALQEEVREVIADNDSPEFTYTRRWKAKC
jgi:hypothetical protein